MATIGVANSYGDGFHKAVEAMAPTKGVKLTASDFPAEPAGAKPLSSVEAIAQLKGDAKVDALLKKGACVSCHGDNFSKPVDPSYPKLAGQHKDYLFVALKSYKSESQATWGRSNGVMGGIAKQFSNAELKALANYVGSQEGELKTIPQSKFR